MSSWTSYMYCWQSFPHLYSWHLNQISISREILGAGCQKSSALSSMPGLPPIQTNLKFKSLQRAWNFKPLFLQSLHQTQPQHLWIIIVLAKIILGTWPFLEGKIHKNTQKSEKSGSLKKNHFVQLWGMPPFCQSPSCIPSTRQRVLKQLQTFLMSTESTLLGIGLSPSFQYDWELPNNNFPYYAAWTYIWDLWMLDQTDTKIFVNPKDLLCMYFMQHFLIKSWDPGM